MVNYVYEGMNSWNTDYTKSQAQKDKEIAIKTKPVQHPVGLNSEDSAIISYKVPPKNLTPYYKVPD